jgi:nitroreductase
VKGVFNIFLAWIFMSASDLNASEVFGNKVIKLEFLEVIKKRRSVHYFTEEKVSDKDLDYVLEAARWAPSAGNCQPWRFVIIREAENIHKVWESTAGIFDLTPQNFIKKASAIIVVCTDTTAYSGRQARIKSDLYCIQDSAAATMNLLLAVCDRGLGACWIGMFNEGKLRTALNIPQNIKPVAIIPVGHTESKEKPRPRKPLTELVYRETFPK